MSVIRNWSIKNKLTAILALTSAVVLVVTCVAFVVFESATFKQEFAGEVSSLADVLGQNCVVDLEWNRPEGAQRTLEALSSEGYIQAACIYDVEGAVFAKYPTNAVALPFSQVPTNQNMAITANRLMVIRSILNRVTQEPVGSIVFQCSLVKAQARMTRMIYISAGILFFAVLVAIGLAAWSQKFIAQPILALASTARQVSTKKDYNLRAIKEYNDEVGVLYDSFNDMLGQIQRRDADLKRTKDEAEEARMQLAAFLRNMSHELRNPLTTIIGFSELLMKDMSEQKHSSWADDLRRIHDKGKYLLAIVNSVLELRKIEKGEIPVELCEFDLRSLIGEAAAGMEHQLKYRKNKLVVDYPANRVMMFSDRVKVNQCLLNLIGNANKFTESGTITVTAWCSKRDAQNWMCISVRDTGIGMDDDQMARLFRPFSQVHKENKYDGFGLGLAITRQLCQMLGGDVSVTSELGKGSVFTIQLPNRLAAQTPIECSKNEETKKPANVCLGK